MLQDVYFQVTFLLRLKVFKLKISFFCNHIYSSLPDVLSLPLKGICYSHEVEAKRCAELGVEYKSLYFSLK